MAQKGHDIFSAIQDKMKPEETENTASLKQIISKEQTQFKQRVEEVQLKLTSPTIEHKSFDEKGM